MDQKHRRPPQIVDLEEAGVRKVVNHMIERRAATMKRSQQR